MLRLFINFFVDIRTLARSVENEVRELLEKYKASRPTESKARENRKAESKAANGLCNCCFFLLGYL